MRVPFTPLTRMLAAMLFGAGLLYGCSTAAPPAAADQAPDVEAAAEVLGLTPVLTYRELMGYIIDPISDYVFEAVAYDVTADGVVETVPETDEDWNQVRQAALIIAEGMNLMKMPRRVAPGDPNVALNPGELPPAEIEAKIAANRDLYVRYADEMREAALQVIQLVNNKDTQGLFDIGGELDTRCENCHLEFWYPGDRTAVENFENSEVFQAEPGSEPPPAVPANPGP